MRKRKSTLTLPYSVRETQTGKDGMGWVKEAEAGTHGDGDGEGDGDGTSNKDEDENEDEDGRFGLCSRRWSPRRGPALSSNAHWAHTAEDGEGGVLMRPALVPGVL